MATKPDHEELEKRIRELEKEKQEYVRIKQEMQYRLQFEELITGISTKFINLPSSDIDNGLNDALKAIGEFADVDRSYIFRYNEERTRMKSIHEWCAPNVESHVESLKQIPIKVFSWLLEKLDRSEVIHIPQTNKLPPEAKAVKEELERQNIQSAIMVPTLSGGSIVGFLGFDSVREYKNWSPDIISLLRIIGEIFTNALDRKRDEEARKETENKYQNILEIMEDGYWEVDIPGHLTFFNDAFLRISRATREQRMGVRYIQYANPRVAKRIYKAFEKVYQTGEPAKIECYEFLRGDGTKGFFEMAASLIRDNTGKPIGFRGISRDVTERVEAEMALRESEARYRAVLEANPDPVVISDMDGGIIYLNPAFEKTFGWALEDQYEKNVDDLVPPVNRDENKIMLDKMLSGESLSGMETQRYTKDGDLIPVSISGAVYRDHEGRPIGRIITMRDIREKKRMEAQLLSAQKLESIGTLAGGIAHDFNNLLTSIQGNVSLSLYDMDDENPLYESLKNIEKSVRSGAKLTQQLLGYARKGRYEVKPIDLNRLIKDTTETFGRAKKEIAFNYYLSPDLPAIEADQGQIEQVLVNIIVNAYQAMPNGGEILLKTMKVGHKDMQGRIYKPRPGHYALVEITDNGVGMDKDIMAHVFEPFFTTKELGRGTGLGLASAYGIVTGHGGYIDVDSEVGKGSTFKIYLPVTNKAVQEKFEPRKKITEGKGTILLVDDEEGILNIAAKILRKLGYTVLEAGSGQKALEIYKDHKDRIDMVILDMIMPHMGGGETFDRIREINPLAKVMLSSGYSIGGQARDILNKGCNGFIQKPFSMANLANKVAEILKT